MMLLGIGVLSLNQAVSFACPVEPLKFVVPELSKATGRKLKVSPDLEWNTVYIRVKDVSPQLLLDQIAKASYGLWQVEPDGTLTLIEDTAQIVARRAKKAADWKKTIGSQLAQQPANESISMGVVRAALRGIGINALSTIEEESRIVFSTHPTRMQQAMRIDPNSIQRLVTSRNEAITKQNERPREKFVIPPEVAGLLSAESRELLVKAFDQPGRPLVTAQVAKANLIVERRINSLQAELIGYSAEGSRLVTASLTLREPRAVAEAPAVGPNEKRAKPLALTKSTAEFLRLLEVGTEAEKADEAGAGRDRSAAQKQVRTMVTDPLRSDPFLVFQTEVIAQGVGPGNVVAHVDGWTLDPRYEDALDSAWLARALSELERSELGGIVILRPSDILYPVDRTAFKRAVELGDLRRLKFDNMAELAYLAEFGGLDGMQWELAEFLIRDDSVNYDMSLALYWSLGQTMREQVKDGRDVSFSALTALSRDMLHEQIYGVYGTFTREWATGSLRRFDEIMDLTEGLDEAVRRISDQMKVITSQASADINDEPTEALPLGVPADGVIRLRAVEEAAYTSVYPSDNTVSTTDGKDLKALLSEIVRSEGGDRNERIAGFRVYRVRRRELSLVAAPNFGTSTKIDEVLEEPSSVRTLDSLEPDALKLLEAFRSNYKAMRKFEEALFGGAGHRYMPPPRN